MRIRLTRALATGAVSTALLLAGAPLTGAGVAAASPRPQAQVASHTVSPQAYPKRRCRWMPGRWVRFRGRWIHVRGHWVCGPVYPVRPVYPGHRQPLPRR
jgi:hypothetical protein